MTGYVTEVALHGGNGLVAVLPVGLTQVRTRL